MIIDKFSPFFWNLNIIRSVQWIPNSEKNRTNQIFNESIIRFCLVQRKRGKKKWNQSFKKTHQAPIKITHLFESRFFFFFLRKNKASNKMMRLFQFFFFWGFVYNFLCNQTLNSGWSNLIRTKRAKGDQRYLVTAAERERVAETSVGF